MNETPTPSRRTPLLVAVAVLLVALLALAGWAGWRWWLGQSEREQQAQTEQQQRLSDMQQALDALRRDQRAANQRLLDAAATNRVLRDEMLGLSQRGALLEDTVAKLADPNRHGAQALRLDEVELLLSQGQQRLAIAGDLDGARRAYALAAGALGGIDDPGYLNLRQTLIQERNALDSAGPGPQATLEAALDQFSAALQRRPLPRDDNPAVAMPWWQKLLSPLVRITPSQGNLPIAEVERVAARDALQIELSLARAAVERGDATGYRAALTRTDEWMGRLWPDTAALRLQRARLAELRKQPLRPAIPELGTTLQQLRAMRDGRSAP